MLLDSAVTLCDDSGCSCGGPENTLLSTVQLYPIKDKNTATVALLVI